MHMTELNSFVQKFTQLWKAGVTAHLDVDTHAGHAWVGLRAQLGQIPTGPPYHQYDHQQSDHPFGQRYRGPSYQRRQERRQAARAAANQAPPTDEVSGEIRTTENVRDAVKATTIDTVEENQAEKVCDSLGKARSDEIPKKATEKVGDPVSDKLVIVLDNNKSKDDEVIDPGSISPILQVDGSIEDDYTAYFSFTSNYAEEDIKYTLDEIFPDKNCSLESYEPCKPRSAEHFCTVKVKDARKKFPWPPFDSIQKDVIRNLERVPG